MSVLNLVLYESKTKKKHTKKSLSFNVIVTIKFKINKSEQYKLYHKVHFLKFSS